MHIHILQIYPETFKLYSVYACMNGIERITFNLSITDKNAIMFLLMRLSFFYFIDEICLN